MVRIEKTSIYNVSHANSLSNEQKKDKQNSIWETNINGEIEDTEQGDTGDCWLLTNLNCMRDTKWGKRLIKDSIQPDGEGGAIITFKGAKPKAKKIHVTAKAIVQARNSGIYSKGDDDVIAMELAVEKYLKTYRNQEYKKAGKALDGNGLDTADFTELLSGIKPNRYYILPPENSFFTEVDRAYKEKLRVLKEIEKHPNEYAVMVSFVGNTLDGVINAKHAYQLKKVVAEKNKKYAILVNPWKSSEKIKIELEKFIPYVEKMIVTEPPGAKPNKNLKSDIERKTDFIKLNSYLLNKLSKVKTVDDLKKLDIEKIKSLIEIIDENNISDLFVNKAIIFFLITACDELKYGWGKGKDKKALIAPLVNSYCEYAKKHEVPEKIITDVKTSCFEELDAMIYTDETVIIEKLQMLFDETEKAREHNLLNKYFRH